MTALPVEEPLAAGPGAVGPLTRAASPPSRRGWCWASRSPPWTRRSSHVDPDHRRRPQRALAAGVGHHRLPDHLAVARRSTAARRRLRPQAAVPVRDLGVHRRLAGVPFAASMPSGGVPGDPGLGAGGLFTLALTIIGDIVSPRERARYTGYFMAVFGTSSVLGPVIGGFFAATP